MAHRAAQRTEGPVNCVLMPGCLLSTQSWSNCAKDIMRPFCGGPRLRSTDKLTSYRYSVCRVFHENYGNGSSVSNCFLASTSAWRGYVKAASLRSEANRRCLCSTYLKVQRGRVPVSSSSARQSWEAGELCKLLIIPRVTGSVRWGPFLHTYSGNGFSLDDEI